MARSNDASIDAQDDVDLAARFNSGDAQAFSELFRRHHKDVTRLVTRMLGSNREAPDVVQEVFLQVYKSLPNFRGQSRLSTWVYRIGVNVVLMHRRAARARPQIMFEEAILPAVDQRPLPDEGFEQSQRVAALFRLMQQLSEKKRTVFILHELQGIAPAEIAQVVGAPVLTVRTRLFYARRELLALIRRDPQLRRLFPELASEGNLTDASANADPMSNNRQGSTS